MRDTWKSLFLVVLMLPLLAVAGAYEDIVLAAKQDRTEVVLNLLQRGMDPNTADVLGTTLVMFAAVHGNMPLLDVLLENRANILMSNRYGDTALGLAALNGHLAVVRRLVYAGARIDDGGWTPLHYAVFNGHVDIVRFLIVAGANVNARAPNQQTSLMLAARNGFPDIVRMLLAAGADRNMVDAEGNTALGIALKTGNDDIAELLRGPPAGGKR